MLFRRTSGWRESVAKLLKSSKIMSCSEIHRVRSAECLREKLRSRAIIFFWKTSSEFSENCRNRAGLPLYAAPLRKIRYASSPFWCGSIPAVVRKLASRDSENVTACLFARYAIDVWFNVTTQISIFLIDKERTNGTEYRARYSQKVRSK